MKRNDFLDVLKGLCILLVVLTHFEWEKEQTLNLLFPFWVSSAVPIFMIISSYVYSESFKRRQISTLKEAYSLKNVADKLMRYSLPFVLIYIIEIALKVFVVNQRMSVGEVVLNLFLGGYGPGSYYFQYMIQFVFVFPLVYFAIKKWDFKGLIVCGSANVVYECVKSLLGMPEENYRLVVLRYVFAVALGCYFSLGKIRIRKWIGVLSVAIGACFIYLDSYLEYQPIVFYWWTKTCMLAVFYIAPISYVLIKRCTWRCKPLEILGRASYNVFLVQMVIFHIMGELQNGIEARFMPMLATYISCIVLGLVFYKIETPITKKIIEYKRATSR